MRLSGTVREIWRFKDNGVTTLTFWGHVTSSVKWPFDSRGSTSYGWSIVSMGLSGTVTEIWHLRYNGVTILTFCWPFDFRGSTFYGWSIVTMRLSGTVMAFWSSSRKALPRTEVGRQSVGLSVFNIALISYTFLRYVRNVAREE